MAQNRAISTGQYRSHPPGAGGESRVTNAVDAGMYSMQASGADTPAERIGAQSHRAQLSRRYNSALAGRQFGHPPVTWGFLCAQCAPE